MATPNPFEPPKGDTDAASAATVVRARSLRLYTPDQIALATLIGLPMAASWLIAANFGLLGNPSARRLSWVVGIAATLPAVFVAGMLMEERPKLIVAVPVVCALAARQLAKELQGRDIDRLFAAGGRREAWWLAIGFGIVCLFASLILFVLVGGVALYFL